MLCLGLINLILAVVAFALAAAGVCLLISLFPCLLAGSSLVFVFARHLCALFLCWVDAVAVVAAAVRVVVAAAGGFVGTVVMVVVGFVGLVVVLVFVAAVAVAAARCCCCFCVVLLVLSALVAAATGGGDGRGGGGPGSLALVVAGWVRSWQSNVDSRSIPKP